MGFDEIVNEVFHGISLERWVLGWEPLLQLYANHKENTITDVSAIGLAVKSVFVV